MDDYPPIIHDAPRLMPIDGQICQTCGAVNSHVLQRPGSFPVEIALWLLLLIPGIVYSVWRHTSRSRLFCAQCGGNQIIPVSSPRGRQLWNDLHGRK